MPDLPDSGGTRAGGHSHSPALTACTDMSRVSVKEIGPRYRGYVVICVKAPPPAWGSSAGPYTDIGGHSSTARASVCVCVVTRVVCMSVFVLQGIFHDLGSMCEGKYRPAMW